MAIDVPTAWRERLASGLAELGAAIDAEGQQRLMAYIALLVKWNAAYNLTAVREPLAMIDRHLIDSLAIAPYLQGPDLADIGSGPGIPGLVLALVHPFERVWVVDSNGKKARFMRECVRQLVLPQCQVHEARAEALNAQPRFQQVVSRAYTDLAEFVSSTRGLIAPDGRWLAMKGKCPDSELSMLPSDVRVEAVHRLAVPRADGERHLVVIRPA